VPLLWRFDLDIYWWERLE
jgi:hypothetical protein